MKEKTNYQDNWFDLAFIWLFSRKIAVALGETTSAIGYEGFVQLSKQVMRGRNSHDQRALISVVLRSLIPGFVLKAIRTFFSPTQLVCELNAWFATVLFEWLVGPLTVKEVEISGKKQKSGVQIEKCRYLEHTGCVGMCINLCKVPTQDFFTKEFGIPLTMTPNFEDFSCEMVFGQVPPPLEEESAYRQSCLPASCSTAGFEAKACPKI